MLARYYVVVVYLSVRRLSQVDVLLKWLNVQSRKHCHTISQNSGFLTLNISAKFIWIHLNRAPFTLIRPLMQIGYVKISKFRQITRSNSKTVQEAQPRFKNWGRCKVYRGSTPKASTARHRRHRWVRLGKEYPLPADYGICRSVVSSPSGVRGRAPAETEFCMNGKQVGT